MDFNPKNWTQAEVNSVLRHGMTAAGTVVATSAIWGLISIGDQTTIMSGLNDIYHGLELFVKGVATIVGAVASIIAARKAMQAASPENAIKNVAAVAADPNQPAASQAKTALVAAANSLPGVAGVVTNDTNEGRALAQSVPSPTVVPAGTQEAVAIAKDGSKS